MQPASRRARSDFRRVSLRLTAPATLGERWEMRVSFFPRWQAVTAAVGATLLGVSGCASRPPLATVPAVDLARYSGTWHEVARYPNFFQRNCESDSKAVYTPLPDGRISVVNSCRERSGRERTARGTATVLPGSGNARLRVNFGGPVSGDYWIIGLDPGYRWAVVGHPSRRYLWILSRTPAMDEPTYRMAVALAVGQGYDPTRLERQPATSP